MGEVEEVLRRLAQATDAVPLTRAVDAALSLLVSLAFQEAKPANFDEFADALRGELESKIEASRLTVGLRAAGGLPS
jgi:hypothetical protein